MVCSSTVERKIALCIL